MTDANMHFQVNDKVVDWAEESNRPLRMCQGCNCKTRGRADGELPDRSFVNEAYCMTCAMNLALRN